MKINIYTRGKKEVIGTYNVRSAYDSTFYFCNMPTLSAKRCRQILNKVSPDYKINSDTLVLENVETGYIGIQEIHRSGTILNF